jgi:fatty acid desaturase
MAPAERPERTLRRLEWMSLAFAAAGLLGFALTGDLGSCLALTLGAAVSIVSFRGLQGIVGRLGAAADGKVDPRSRRRIWLRFSTLLLVPLASIWLGSDRILALIAGFSVLPLALLAEAFLQIVTSLRAHDNHGG